MFSTDGLEMGYEYRIPNAGLGASYWIQRPRVLSLHGTFPTMPKGIAMYIADLVGRKTRAVLKTTQKLETWTTSTKATRGWFCACQKRDVSFWRYASYYTLATTSYMCRTTHPCFAGCPTWPRVSNAPATQRQVTQSSKRKRLYFLRVKPGQWQKPLGANGPLS